MEKRIWLVDDGDISVADNECDAYYSALRIVMRDDPDAAIMLISDCLSDEIFLQLGKYVNDRISEPIVKEYVEV